MSIENAFLGFLIIADLALVALFIAGVVEFRKSENHFKNLEREKRENFNRLNSKL
jgi:CHASE1-domain containing sensor protein